MSSVKLLMNREEVGSVNPNRIPPYVEPFPTFLLSIYDCKPKALQRIHDDAISGPIEPIKMQAGDREFFANIEEIEGGHVFTVRIAMTRSR